MRGRKSTPADRPGLPRLFDAHLHIVDPAFPLQANDGFVPDAFGVDAYRAATEPLGVVAGAVVFGSFQGVDQGYLRAALRRLGPTDLPSTRARRPFHPDDLALLRRALPASAVEPALFGNAAAWYGVGKVGAAG